MAERLLKVSARELAEYACMSGDLAPGAPMSQMVDGIRAHQSVAKLRLGALIEAPIACDIIRGELSIRLTGRIDVYYPGETPIVEEVKSTRSPLHSVKSGGYDVHWAQALGYAYAIVKRERCESIEIKLTYVSLYGGREDEMTLTRLLPRDKVESSFEGMLNLYLDWTYRLMEHRRARDESLDAVKFPYPNYRAGQRDMMKTAYATLRDGRFLLAEAPTGIGKTMAAAFPALKALAKGHVSAIFYLTARGTAQMACQDAMARLRQSGAHIRGITITAKEKICPNGECAAYTCPRAQGYYDRLRAAMIDSMSTDDLSRMAIEAFADKHTLCPFELSLDLSQTCDVIACDYNYAFDPRVSLKRFFQKKGKWALLIDEAHNLPKRSRDMLTVRFIIEETARAAARLTEDYGEGSIYARAAAQVLAIFSGIPQPYVSQDIPGGLKDALAIYVEAVEERLNEADQSAVNLWFDAKFSVEIFENWGENYCILAENGEVTLQCLDASEYLAKRYKMVKGGLLFSATLSPSGFYYAQCGLKEDRGDGAISLPSPFPEEHLLTLALPIATRYKSRASTFEQVAGAIAAMARGKVGNYIACFPSHAYLAQILTIFKGIAPEIDALVQRPNLRASRRAAFLSKFVDNPQRTMVAFIVLGGVFAEGIDLPGARLSGAAIVGIGLPQICLERDALRAYSQKRYEYGYEFAYVYPGMCKVMQAAGRVIRTDEDRGVVTLIDDRYYNEEIQSLLPPHWRVNYLSANDDVLSIIEEFWGREK